MTQPAARILIADDDESIRWVLARHFESQERPRYTVDQAATGTEAIQRLESGAYDLILLDIRMPPPSGLEILTRLVSEESLASNREAAVLIMTAQDTMTHAIEAMRAGAFDYVPKPFDLDALSLTAQRALESRRQEREIRLLRRHIETSVEEETTGPPSRNPAMQAIYKSIGRIARRPINVLIMGESGSGKEVIARAIHRAASPSMPFVPLNMAALPRDLIEAELFGNEKGAFTGALESRPGKFELAGSGTLFLDEVGEMDLDLQAKLLRVIEEGVVYPLGSKRAVPVNPRVIAATHRRLEQAVAEGRFREDLYYRLNVFPISLPPLRERREDVGALAEYFRDRYAREFELGEKVFQPEAIERLVGHSWPGNVRELENLVKRALLISEGPYLTPADFPSLASVPGQGSGAPGAEENPDEAFESVIYRYLVRTFGNLDPKSDGELHAMILDRVERPLIRFVLEKTGGNQLRAARMLGLNRNTLRKRIHELDITLRRGVSGR